MSAAEDPRTQRPIGGDPRTRTEPATHTPGRISIIGGDPRTRTEPATHAPGRSIIGGDPRTRTELATCVPGRKDYVACRAHGRGEQDLDNCPFCHTTAYPVA